MAGLDKLTIATEDYGDSAVMITIDDVSEAERRRQISLFRARVLGHRPTGVTDLVSGLESLLIEFDPLSTSPAEIAYVARLLAELGDEPGPAAGSPARHFEIPVVLDRDWGPDLPDVAGEQGLTERDVVRAVTGSEFTVSLLGAAMAPMMDGLRLPAPVRRQTEPRTDVASGSIMIAGRNAIIQPFPGPTGWRVIGRTTLTIVDIQREPPVSFAVGDSVAFVEVGRDEATARDGAFLEPVKREGIA
jgi:KipI family sensor histidine kinase inhibitor